MSGTLRIMTWNVHGTFNLNPDFDVDGVCKIIEKWTPDIVALQEIDSRGHRGDVFGKLAESVGEHRVEAHSIIAADGYYGQALLSRWPFASEPEVSDVSFRKREPRRVISACVTCPGGDVKIIATHLGLSVHERYTQAQTIAGLIDDRKTIVLGDFNDWLWVKSVRRVLASYCPVRTRLRTFPSRWPLLRLDRIYATPDATMAKAWTDREAAVLSDHLPVIAEVAFR